MELLNIKNLEKIYSEKGKPVHALRGVDLKIEEGEFLVIAGPSGSGKTTLLNLIGALDEPTKGEIKLKGEDLAHKNRKELSELRLNKFGFVFQAYNLIPVLTALENAEFPMMLQGVPKKERRDRAMQALSELGIGDLAGTRPLEMSGGQQQRVAVARALAAEPLLILADEPTANLDSKTGAQLLDLMKKMNEEKNVTFVFSSHDEQVIDRAERLVVLKDGEISAE